MLDAIFDELVGEVVVDRRVQLVTFGEVIDQVLKRPSIDVCRLIAYIMNCTVYKYIRLRARIYEGPSTLTSLMCL